MKVWYKLRTKASHVCVSWRALTLRSTHIRPCTLKLAQSQQTPKANLHWEYNLNGFKLPTPCLRCHNPLVWWLLPISCQDRLSSFLATLPSSVPFPPLSAPHSLLSDLPDSQFPVGETQQSIFLTSTTSMILIYSKRRKSLVTEQSAEYSF